MARFFVSFFVLVAIACATEACKCAQRHPQVYFCEADFALVARVLSKRIIEDGQTIRYRLNIIKVFKETPEADEALESRRVFTSSSSASCGAILDVGRKYVMTGTVSDGRANINSCGFIRKWGDITDYQALGFDSEYENACSCTIEPCSTPETCAEVAPDNVCRLNSENSECYFTESTCTPDENGKCNWNGSEFLSECLV